MQWSPLDGICNYVDDKLYKPKMPSIVDRHEHCAKRLEDVIARVEYFQTVVFPMKYGGLWEVQIYFEADTVGMPMEWFGAACCQNAAIAMALEDYAE